MTIRSVDDLNVYKRAYQAAFWEYEEIEEALAYAIVRSPFRSPLLLSSPFSLLHKREV